MIAYRSLAQKVHARAGLARFEEVLESISVVLKCAAHQLNSQEAGVLKKNIAHELRQVVSEGRPSGRHDAKQLVDLVARLVEIPREEAEKRTLLILEELKAGASPWDEVEFVEILEQLERAVRAAQVPTQVQALDQKENT